MPVKLRVTFVRVSFSIVCWRSSLVEGACQPDCCGLSNTMGSRLIIRGFALMNLLETSSTRGAMLMTDRTQVYAAGPQFSPATIE